MLFGKCTERGVLLTSTIWREGRGERETETETETETERDRDRDRVRDRDRKRACVVESEFANTPVMERNHLSGA